MRSELEQQEEDERALAGLGDDVERRRCRLAFWWFIDRLILIWILSAIVVLLLRGVYHVYIISRSGRPTPGDGQVLTWFGFDIVIHAIDVFRSVV